MKKRAQKIAGGGDSAEVGDKGLSIVASKLGSSSTPNKGGRGKKGAVVLVEIAEGSQKKSALQDINLPFILWGHTQGYQLAGVWPSELLGHPLRICVRVRLHIDCVCVYVQVGSW